MKVKVTITVEKLPTGEKVEASSNIDSEQPFMQTALQVADVFRVVWSKFQKR